MRYDFDMIQTPNQKFNTNIGDDNFEFNFHTFRGVMYADVKVNDVQCDVGVVCIPNKSLFNSRVNVPANGTFQFVSLKDDYVSSDDFDGVTTIFAYFSNEN